MSRSVVGIAAVAVGLLAVGCTRSTAPGKQPSGPAALISIDSVESPPGQGAAVKLRLLQTGEVGSLLDTLEEIELLFFYDTRSLQFLPPPKRGPEISRWDDIVYKFGKINCDTCTHLEAVRIIARRDIAGIDAAGPPQYSPDGILLTLYFWVHFDLNLVGTRSNIGFCLLDWRDNSITRQIDPPEIFTPDTTLGRISYIAGYDTLDSPRRFKLRPVLELQGGSIRIVPPPPTTVTGAIPDSIQPERRR